MINFGQKINLIQRNFEMGGYTIVAKECVGLIEQAFRQLFSKHLTDLDEKDRLKIQKAELEIGKGEKGIESFTMGQLVGVFRTSRFLDAWARTSGRELGGLRMINLEELTNLRNKLIHEGREATRAEAEFFINCLHVILETFDLVSPEEAERSFIEVEHTVIMPERVSPGIRSEDAAPLQQLKLSHEYVSEKSPITGITLKRAGSVSRPGRSFSYKYLVRAIGIGIVCILMFRISYPHLLELKVLDWKFKIKQQYQSSRMKGQITIRKEKVIIVSFNDDFLDNDLISREKLAELLTLVSKKNPKVIGLDILLDKSREGDDALAEAIKSAGNVVLPFELKADNSGKSFNISPPLPEFTEFSEVGFANFSQHPIDGVVRELRPLRVNAGDRIYYPFSVQILRSFYADQDIEDILGANPEKEHFLRIDFEEKDRFIVLGPGQIEHGAFKDFYYGDKIVLIGYLGEKQPHDSFLTPLSIRGKKMNGVVLQANILNTVYLRRYLRSWSILDVLIIFAFACVGHSLNQRRRIRLLIAPSVLVSYSVIMLCLFIFMRIDIPLWAPILTMTLTTFLPQRTST